MQKKEDLDTGGKSVNKEDKEQAQKEMQEIIGWARIETDRVIAKLKEEGKWNDGLDGNIKELEVINAQYREKMDELVRKYRKKE